MGDPVVLRRGEAALVRCHIPWYMHAEGVPRAHGCALGQTAHKSRALSFSAFYFCSKDLGGCTVAVRLAGQTCIPAARPREHPGSYANIPGMFMNTCGMFVFRWGCSWSGFNEWEGSSPPCPSLAKRTVFSLLCEPCARFTKRSLPFLPFPRHTLWRLCRYWRTCWGNVLRGAYAEGLQPEAGGEPSLPLLRYLLRFHRRRYRHPCRLRYLRRYLLRCHRRRHLRRCLLRDSRPAGSAGSPALP